MSSASNLKRVGPIGRKRIDDHAELYPPLDYSFHNAQQIEDAVAVEPRVALGALEPVKEGIRYHSYAVNFNHNMLCGPLETLPDILRSILMHPEALSTLDLSFNTFTEIPAAITQFPSLKYFYFHKNLLADLREIQKLLSLKDLKYLTLHGNPIEIQVKYLRPYILCLFPNLKSFNCTALSKGDLDSSQIWGQMHKNLLPKYFDKISRK